eukprot:2342204-Pyramimonas_sp.AAC.1
MPPLPPPLRSGRGLALEASRPRLPGRNPSGVRRRHGAGRSASFGAPEPARAGLRRMRPDLRPGAECG